MKRILSLAFLCLPGVSMADDIYTGPFGPDGTWNVYQLIRNSITWEEARKEAEKLPAPAGDPAAKGHLVTFGTIAENHFVRNLNRQVAWCGLSDDERFGGREAGSNPNGGWKWYNEGPATFSNWFPNQPDEWKDEGAGEDGVYFEWSGRWADGASGTGGQGANRFYFAVEWETHSKTPVAGAIPHERAWPAKSVIPDLVPGKWNARWASGYVKFPNNWIERPRTLADAMVLLQPPAEAAGSKLKTRPQGQGAASGKLLLISTPGAPSSGWLPGVGSDGNFQELPTEDQHVGAVVGKIHVETAGPYTFSISSRDAFALRIGGKTWKSAVGQGYIDPLDPLTVTQPNGSYVSKTLAVMDLPAGDHLVEALWMTENGRPEFQVLSAPGIQPYEGSTTDWRPLGYVPRKEKILRLGVTDAGWAVECSRPGAKHISLQDGLINLNLDSAVISKTGVPAINFSKVRRRQRPISRTHPCFPTKVPAAASTTGRCELRPVWWCRRMASIGSDFARAALAHCA